MHGAGPGGRAAHLRARQSEAGIQAQAAENRIEHDDAHDRGDVEPGRGESREEELPARVEHSHRHGRKGRLYEVPNGAYGVPYRCLLPKGVENLYIASRAASFSHIAASSCRLCRTMMTLGQAAGNAAVMAVRQGLKTRQVDVAELQAELVAQGVAITA